MTVRFLALTFVAVSLAACGKTDERPKSAPSDATLDLEQPLPPLDSDYPEPLDLGDGENT